MNAQRRADLQWRVGTIGFSYPEWRGVFYPRGLPAGEQLRFYARYFDTVELDTTFHAMPSPQRVLRWAEQVPEHFQFTVKTPRQVTHDPDPAGAVTLMRLFLDTLRPMGEKLGAVVLQFAPTFDARHRDDLLRLLDATLHGVPAAVEFRHASWEQTDIADRLRDRGVALVASDLNDHARPTVATAPITCLRLIGLHERFPARNREEYDIADRLAWWIARIERDAQSDGKVYAMVSNDYAGYAIATARRLLEQLGRPVPALDLPARPDENLLFE